MMSLQKRRLQLSDPLSKHLSIEGFLNSCLMIFSGACHQCPSTSICQGEVIVSVLCDSMVKRESGLRKCREVLQRKSHVSAMVWVTKRS